MYDVFRDAVAWRPSLGDTVVPGLPNLGPAQTIPARTIDKLVRVGGDKYAERVVWTLPEHAVQPGDHIDGVPVVAVESVKDPAGNVKWWVCYV